MKTFIKKRRNTKKILKGGTNINNNYTATEKEIKFLSDQVNQIQNVLSFLEKIKKPFTKSDSNNISNLFNRKKNRFINDTKKLDTLLQSLREIKKSIQKRTNPTKLKHKLKKIFGLYSSKLSNNRLMLSKKENELKLYNSNNFKRELFDMLKGSIIIIGQIMASLIKTVNSLLLSFNFKNNTSLTAEIDNIENRFNTSEKSEITSSSFESLNQIFNDLKKLYDDFNHTIINNLLIILGIKKPDTDLLITSIKHNSSNLVSEEKSVNPVSIQPPPVNRKLKPNQQQLNNNIREAQTLTQEETNKIYNLLLVIDTNLIENGEKQNYLEILEKYLQKYKKYLDQEKKDIVSQKITSMKKSLMTTTPLIDMMLRTTGNNAMVNSVINTPITNTQPINPLPLPPKNTSRSIPTLQQQFKQQSEMFAPKYTHGFGLHQHQESSSREKTIAQSHTSPSPQKTPKTPN